MNKLYIKETINKADDDVYTKISHLGYMCILASNDMYHIHLHCIGKKFQEIHQYAEEYHYKLVQDADTWFELALEGLDAIPNINTALDIIPEWNVVTDLSFNFNTAFKYIEDTLSCIVNQMKVIRNTQGITTDLESLLDDKIRHYTKEVNYFINRKLR